MSPDELVDLEVEVARLGAAVHVNVVWKQLCGGATRTLGRKS